MTTSTSCRSRPSRWREKLASRDRDPLECAYLVEDFSRLQDIDAKKCGGRAGERFGPRRMAEGYEEIYLDEAEAVQSGWRA